MLLDLELLNRRFEEFANFIAAKDNAPFVGFDSSKFIDTAENYKYSVYDEAREQLAQKWWKPEDIGSGRIQAAVSNAIKTRVNHSFQMINNNLVDWRKKDDFSKQGKSKALETTLFNFYKSKISDQSAFDSFVAEKLSYQFIAYLFFIKDRNRFMPISQAKFDEIFVSIGLPGFKTSHNLSWENYNTYINIVKQVRDFLKTKDKNVTLLDAHSFLWILGNQMVEEHQESRTKPISPRTSEMPKPSTEVLEIYSREAKLNKHEWIEILKNSDITNTLDISIFQALYSFQDQKAYASQVALVLGTTHSHLNLEIGRYAKRIATYYNVNFTLRTAEKFKFWDLFFKGWYEGKKFVWQLRLELAEAMEAEGLTGDEVFPEELPSALPEKLFEGVKRTITVNAYERNSKARSQCLNYWKTICAVCEFDFEKTYGDIGKGFIHVHHITPLAHIGESYEIDPIHDLIPVFPNCHAMLHRKEPPYSVQELKTKLGKA